jgi:hypothetical protein
MFNTQRNLFWIIIGGAICLFVFVLMAIQPWHQGNTNSAPSPLAMIDQAPIARNIPDDHQDDRAVQNSVVLSTQSEPEKKEFYALPPPNKEAMEIHKKIASGLNGEIREQTRRLYNGAFQQLRLPTDIQEKVIDILTQQQKQLEQQAFDAAQSGSIPEPPSPESIQAEQLQEDQQLRSALGDSAFAAFNQYRATIPDRIIVDALNQQGANLSQGQAQQLLQILTEARQQIVGQAGLAQNLNSMSPDQAIATIERQQALLQQAVGSRVQNVLTPEQATTLQAVLMQQRSIGPTTH